MNAFRGQTVEEMLHALMKAGWDKKIAAIVLTGTGDRAFCTGGDQSAHSGQYDGRGTVGLPVEELHSTIRDVPKPVIARVQGYAIGGGNVLATLCDLTIASEKAVFGQVGPKVGSVDPGWGTAYLAPSSARRRRARSGTCAAATARRSAGDGAVQRGRAARPARRRGGQVVPRDRREEPDRAGHRQALVQRRDRAHPRHRQPGACRR
jgi:1,4-dihydroxy-2-naphthoyl-CoA synthase